MILFLLRAWWRRLQVGIGRWGRGTIVWVRLDFAYLLLVSFAKFLLIEAYVLLLSRLPENGTESSLDRAEGLGTGSSDPRHCPLK